MARPPREFEGFIGHVETVRLLQRHIDGARRRGGVLAHALLTGDPGLGKTTLARAAARQMQTSFRALIASRDMDVPSLVELLAVTEHGDVLFIDEAHALDVRLQEVLLGAVGEDRRIQKIEGRRVSVSETMSVAEFTLILATDRPGQLHKALLSRVHLRLDLTPYPLREMRAIVERVAQEHAVRLSTHAVTVLAEAARGVPREAVKLINLAAAYHPDQEFSKPVVEEFLVSHGIDPGTMLRESERRYLALLHKARRPLSLDYLSTAIGTDTTDAKRNIERFLIREGLLTTGPRGRELTEAGSRFAKRFAADLEVDGDERQSDVDETREVGHED